MRPAKLARQEKKVRRSVSVLYRGKVINHGAWKRHATGSRRQLSMTYACFGAGIGFALLGLRDAERDLTGC
jgi:hypothetical protein